MGGRDADLLDVAKYPSVAFVVSGTMFGGGQRVVLDLYDMAVRHRRGVTIVTLGDRAGGFDGVSTRVVRYDGRYNRPVTVLGVVIRLRRLFKESHFDIVHTHGWDADCFAWLSAIRFPSRQVVHLHVNPGWLVRPNLRSRIRRWITRYLLQSSSVTIVAASEGVRKNWANALDIPLAHIRVVKNGVDVNAFCPEKRQARDRNSFVVGVAARLVKMKGLEYLLDAVGEMHGRGKSIELRVAGVGGEKESLIAQCQSLGIGQCVKFLGKVTVMPAFYRDLDVFVLPSVSAEGLPLVLLEAMASGIPVIATRVPGSVEVVRSGSDGLLVKPADSTALRHAIESLVGDEQMRSRMGREARARVVREFSMSRVFEELEDVYEGVASRRTSVAQ